MDKSDFVSYTVYEESVTRSDKIIHRLIVAILLAIVLLFVSNALWLYVWSNHDGESVSNKDGTSNYIGGNGSIENGE